MSYKKVFETVRSASKASTIAESQQFPRLSSMTTSTLSIGSTGPRMSSMSQGRIERRKCGRTNTHTLSLDSDGHSDSESSLLTDSEEYP